MEGRCYGEEDGHGDVGRVVQEAGQRDGDEEQAGDEDIQVGVERVGGDGGGAGVAVAVVREPVRPPARPPVVLLDLSDGRERIVTS